MLLDRPYYPQDQLTPVSASPSRSTSPMGRSQSPYGKPMRNAPIQTGPPSPEMFMSLDSPFPPFPMSKPQDRSQQGGGYGGMGRMNGEANPMYAPRSPRTATSGGLLQRMNTIAPGPFDVNKRRNAEDAPAGKGHRRQGTEGSLGAMTMSTATAEVGSSIRRPSTAGTAHSRTPTTSSNESRTGIAPPKVPRKNGYGGFGPPGGDDYQPQPLSADGRSSTFPLRSESQGPTVRRPSEPGTDPRNRRPSNESGQWAMGNERSVSGSPPRQRRPSISGPDRSRPLPPRGASLIRPRVDARMGDAPPVPSNLNLAAEFGIGNPYHTP